MSAVYTTADFAETLARAAARLVEAREELCRLDGVVGDGDHGVAMADGFSAASKAARGATFADATNSAAKALLNAVGASSGPLYATALMRAAKAGGARSEMPIAETRALIVAMADGIAARGKAVEGERTMVDAWGPAARAAAEGGSFEAIADAARTGSEATRQMIALKGRSSRLGDRAIGHIDPGAASAALLVETFTLHWREIEQSRGAGEP